MKIFLYILVATILEACGDSIVRVALHHPPAPLRFALFFLVACCCSATAPA